MFTTHHLDLSIKEEEDEEEEEEEESHWSNRKGKKQGSQR